MRIVVIGATGHVGTYLVPRLVRGGHEVVALSRGEREPYHAGARVARGRAGRGRPRGRGRGGTFGERIAALGADAVIDMICFTRRRRRGSSSTRCARRGRCCVHCGTIWVHGPAARVPVTEDEPRTAYGEYGTGKAAIEALLQRETIAGGVPERRAPSRAHQRARLAGHHAGRATSTPTCGGGWPTGEPLAAARPRARRAAPRARRRRRAGVRARAHAAGGDRLELPRRRRAGDDAARAGRRRRRRGSAASRCSSSSTGRSSSAASAPSTPQATREHVGRSIAASIDRARAVLGYAPRYTSLDALHEALRWLVGERARWTSAAQPV